MEESDRAGRAEKAQDRRWEVSLVRIKGKGKKRGEK
jgi:hypothetical protein